MAFSRTYDGDEPVRINKWLGQTGVCSRREADALIADGLVSVEGEVVTDAGRKLEPGQTLTLSDRATATLAEGITIVMHKPLGFVSGQPEPDKIPAIRLLTADNLVGPGEAPPEDMSLPPIGRLDEDSRGLLLCSRLASGTLLAPVLHNWALVAGHATAASGGMSATAGIL